MAEVFRLDRIVEVESQKVEIFSGHANRLFDKLSELVDRSETRADQMLSKQNEILDQRLGLNQQARPQIEIKPIAMRKPWNQVAAKFEADKRQEYWRQKNKQTEELDRKIIQPEKQG